MTVDGKIIAAELLEQTAKDTKTLPPLTLAAITCAPDFATQRYLEMKRKKAQSVGITVDVIELPATITTDDMIAHIHAIANNVSGVVVQLPLPEQIDTKLVLQSIPPAKDPDVFCYGEKRDRLLPPVVGAINEISLRHNIVWKNKRVVVLGQGTLVGKPAARYARKQGARVRVYDKDTLDVSSLKTADIIVSGIGQSHMLRADMVKSGVILFDAGTSEDGGELVGDMHPEIHEVSKLYTPVPGGIGPVTIAYLLKNLVTLNQP